MRLLQGLLLELRPLPVIATLIAVYLAFLQGGAQATIEIPLFFLSVFFLLYMVHFLDTYEDYYVRKEDQFKTFTFAHGSGGLLKKEELIACALICSLMFFAIVLYLSSAGPAFLLLNLTAYAIGVSYSRYLSKNPFISLISAPVGALLAMCGVYLLSSGAIDLKIMAYSMPFFLLFCGATAWMDLADAKTDQKSGKPNASLVLGMRTAKRLGLSFLLGGLVFALGDGFPILAAAALCIVFYRGFVLEPEDGVPYVMGGIFAFLVFSYLMK